ncbi:MAG: hypothetical protein Q9181_000488 [Wetmoreana brouardii]
MTWIYLPPTDYERRQLQSTSRSVVTSSRAEDPDKKGDIVNRSSPQIHSQQCLLSHPVTFSKRSMELADTISSSPISTPPTLAARSFQLHLGHNQDGQKRQQEIVVLKEDDTNERDIVYNFVDNSINICRSSWVCRHFYDEIYQMFYDRFVLNLDIFTGSRWGRLRRTVIESAQAAYSSSDTSLGMGTNLRLKPNYKLSNAKFQESESFGGSYNCDKDQIPEYHVKDRAMDDLPSLLHQKILVSQHEFHPVQHRSTVGELRIRYTAPKLRT